jgi:hypothetical protein
MSRIAGDIVGEGLDEKAAGIKTGGCERRLAV